MVGIKENPSKFCEMRKGGESLAFQEVQQSRRGVRESARKGPRALERGLSAGEKLNLCSLGSLPRQREEEICREKGFHQKECPAGTRTELGGGDTVKSRASSLRLLRKETRIGSKKTL